MLQLEEVCLRSIQAYSSLLFNLCRINEDRKDNRIEKWQFLS